MIRPSSHAAASFTTLQYPFCYPAPLFAGHPSLHWITSANVYRLRANRRDASDKNLLHLAVESGNERLVRPLVGKGAKASNGGINSTLALAIQTGREPLIRMALEAGADPLAKPYPRVGSKFLLIAGNYLEPSQFKDMTNTVLEAGGSSYIDIKGVHGFNLLCEAADRWLEVTLRRCLSLMQTQLGSIHNQALCRRSLERGSTRGTLSPIRCLQRRGRGTDARAGD